MEYWKNEIKRLYIINEDEPTYVEAYKWNDLYIVHGEIEIYCFDSNFNEKWKFAGRDVWITRDGTEAISFTDDCIVLKDWLGYTYRVNCNGEEL